NSNHHLFDGLSMKLASLIRRRLGAGRRLQQARDFFGVVDKDTADIASGGEIREHLAGVLSRLTLEARWFRLWPFAGSFLAFSRASTFVLRRNAGGWWWRTVFLV